VRLRSWHSSLAPRDPTLVAAIEQRRGGVLLNLDRVLLWSEPLARSWNIFLRTLRQGLSLNPRIRELAICVVARVTGATYEFLHHAPEFQRAGGSEAQLALLDDLPASAASPLFDRLERATIHFALASTKSVEVPDDVFDVLLASLSEQEIVELAAVVGAYNMVARVLVALQVPHESN